MRRLILSLMVLGLATAGTTALSGCPARTNCKKMKQKMDKCSSELWTRLEPRLRGRIPDNRLRSYDVRTVIGTLADTASVLELRGDSALGIRTALARVEGRPIGMVANNPQHLGGAIDAAGADKAARFLQLCDAFDVPVLFLCDTPGIMVGPEAEETALLRHVSRLFLTGATPWATVINCCV